MSAFLCSDKHLSALVNAADSDTLRYFGSRNSLPDISRSAYFQLLLDANLLSLDARYGEGTDVAVAQQHRYRGFAGEFSGVEILKLINSYEYQSCEDDSWESSLAKQFCDALRGDVIRSLPGYDEAEWAL